MYVPVCVLLLCALVLLLHCKSQTIPGMETFVEIAPSVRGLPKMVYFCYFKCFLFSTYSEFRIFFSLVTGHDFAIFSEYVQIIESINKCDVDIRRELFSSILVTLILIWCPPPPPPSLFFSISFPLRVFPGFKVWPQLKLILFVSQLTGGTASMQQLKERIEKELLEVRVLCFMLFKFMKVCFVLWGLSAFNRRFLLGFYSWFL